MAMACKAPVAARPCASAVRPPASQRRAPAAIGRLQSARSLLVFQAKQSPSQRRSLAVTVHASSGSVVAAGSEAAPEAPPPKKVSKPRLPALDSIRFFLIAMIATGHFIACCTKNVTVLSFFSQINVIVGAFFVLSGYVAAYVATEIGKYVASPRVAPAHTYIIQRIFGYYPLYLFVNLLFLPMFVFADNFYNGPIATAWHGFLTFTLSQAWFPMHAELWNAPTWFLSALTFAMMIMPFALPVIASWTKKHLKLALGVLTGTSLISKIAYSYDLNVWTIMEGMTSPKAHPNMAFWNMTRFHPFYAVLEVLLGAVACRLVMLDGVDGDEEDKKKPASSLYPAVGMVLVLLARTFGLLTLNDPLTRCLIFLPLFTIFLLRLHRETIYNAGKGFAAFLSAKPFVYLGTISFPIYIVHGALGQLFYKKVIAMKVFGLVFVKYPWFFGVYWLIVMASAVLLHHFFVCNDTVKSWSKTSSTKLAALMD